MEKTSDSSYAHCTLELFCYQQEVRNANMMCLAVVAMEERVEGAQKQCVYTIRMVTFVTEVHQRKEVRKFSCSSDCGGRV